MAFTNRPLVRILVPVGIGMYAIARLRNPEYWDLLDDVNLAIHEAGHVLFQPLGDPLVVLGGSLFQVIVPLAFVMYFFARRELFSASVVMAWVAASLANVAVYVGDARAQELPLLGGENVIHDWWYLLIEWDLLSSDHSIARWMRLTSGTAFVTSVAGCFMFAGAATSGSATSTVTSRSNAPGV